ncbi:MAG: hypothetical protein PUB12_10815 [[Clostridium] aminophilum]|nr:hypothetical protein [[Clostridium] aminophilum]
MGVMINQSRCDIASCRIDRIDGVFRKIRSDCLDAASLHHGMG